MDPATERPYEFATTAEGPVLRVRARGFSVLGTPMLNRGTAFTPRSARRSGWSGCCRRASRRSTGRSAGSTRSTSASRTT